MKIFRIICLMIIIPLLSVSLLSCASKQKETDFYFPSKKDVAYSMEASIKGYSDTQELMLGSKDVVIGKIVSSDRSVKSGSIDYEISVLEIEKVVKGNLSVGDKINIQETGLKTDDGDVSIGGVPLLKENMRVMLYLRDSTTATLDGETSYAITGCFYGKFFFDNSKTLYPSTELSIEHPTPLSDFSKPLPEKEAFDIVTATK